MARVICAVALMFLSFMVASAQQTSTILGTVVDSQKSLIVGATVTVTSDTTGDQRKAATDVNGSFSMAGLQAGSYTLKVESSGFQTTQRTGINLTASERLSVGAITMNIGSVAETLTVSADAAVVATVSSEGSASLNSRQIETISQRGRNVTSYLRLLPGANTAATEVEALNSMEIGTPLQPVGGIRGGAISIGMDGQHGQDNGTSSSYTSSQSPETVEEVKVLLNNYQAEYGRNGGAMINLITKSGGREFHGSAYWYKRHEMFNAQNFFNNRNKIPMARYRYTTLGATLSGPVSIPGVFNKNREKVFFFLNYESNPSKEPKNIVQRTMPTDLEIGGNFSQTLDQAEKLIPVIDPTTKAPFAGNIIPASRLNSSGQALMKILPRPNRFDRTVTKGAYNYEYQDVYNFTRKTLLFKVDYKVTDKDSIYLRGTKWTSNREGEVMSSGAYEFARTSNDYFNKHAAFNWTRIVSATMVNDLNLGIRRPQERMTLSNSDPAAAHLKRKQAGFTAGQWHPEINPDDIIPQARFQGGGISNGPDFGNFYWYRIPQLEDDTNFTIADGFTVNRSAHTFKVGAYYEKDRVTAGYGMGTIWNGYYSFNGDSNNPLNTGNPYSNAALGVFTDYQEATARTKPAATAINFDWYVQDSWKVSSRVTLELGLRVAYYTPWYQWDGQNTGWSMERYDPTKAPKLYQPGMVDGKRVSVNPVTNATSFPALIGGIVPNTGDPGNGFVTTRDGKYPVGFYEKSGELFQPRFGFAWDVFGDGSTAVRGGFAKFNQILRWEPQSAGAPIAYTPIMYYGTLDSFLNASGTLFPSSGNGYQRDMRSPSYYNFTLGIQRNLGGGILLDAKYVGAPGRNLQMTRSINMLPYGVRFLPQNQDPTTGKPLTDNFLRPYAGLGNITYREASGSSNYHALQVAANRRMAQGLQFGFSYSYAKTMDFGTSLPIYNNARTYAYGKADFDQTHSLVINYTYDVPRFNFGNAFTKLITNNWQISGITTLASGTPYGASLSTTTGVDLTGGGDNQRANLIADPRVAHGDRTMARFFNTAAFALPGLGDRGNAARDVIRGPGVNNFDATVFKNIPLKGESRHLQLRWEIYNLLNHTQWATIDRNAKFNPTTGVQTNPLFGTATAARAPRMMQVALKFAF